MTIITHVVLRDVSTEQYDAVRAECGWLASRTDGGIAHLAGGRATTTTTLTCGRARRRSDDSAKSAWVSAMTRVGVTAEPEVTFHPADEVFLPAATTLTAT